MLEARQKRDKDKLMIFSQGRLNFPRIYGINNNQSYSNSLNNTNDNLENSAANTFLRIGNIGNFFANLAGDFVGSLTSFISDYESTVAGIPDLKNATSVIVPAIPNLPDPENLPYIPGLSEALVDARNHLHATLNITSDISTGIHDVIHNALLSGDPVGASRALIETILKVYGTVAAHCPLIIVGERIIQEGVRLSVEVLRSIRNVTE
ncbi:uncharacterized protein LOC117172980 isoform X2 [Belonocnema kinseyi]|uniref:uncharacterized protein LOC117172980 isoform X2 n=1 Tax=Belonocnema kinseyi TaxID=2817044 RepID=UPI00143D48E2|nr:uncharacterized protein LOC117172980 isoform X2 [Belonocnema kinseyi]